MISVILESSARDFPRLKSAIVRCVKRDLTDVQANYFFAGLEFLPHMSRILCHLMLYESVKITSFFDDSFDRGLLFSLNICRDGTERPFVLRVPFTPNYRCVISSVSYVSA